MKLVLRDGERVEMDLAALRAGPWWLDTPGRLAITNQRVVFVSGRKPWFRPVSELLYAEIDDVDEARRRHKTITSGFEGEGISIRRKGGEELVIWLEQGANEALRHIRARLAQA
jgi:hypothetical protein